MKKKPSKQLIALLEKAIYTKGTLADLWKEIRDTGAKEGFTGNEISGMLRPYLKNPLTTSQTNYLFWAETLDEKSRGVDA